MPGLPRRWHRSAYLPIVESQQAARHPQPPGLLQLSPARQPRVAQSMKNIARFAPTVSPKQGNGPPVLCFTARPDAIMEIARIERIGRDGVGRLSGFQRPQIASHIREIRDYLAQPGAMLPNVIVLGFTREKASYQEGALLVDVSEGPPGWVVDGQQRLCAALGLPDTPFEFVVSAFLCDDMDELNRQFILINNTRPLAKPLIYELIPGLDGL